MLLFCPAFPSDFRIVVLTPLVENRSPRELRRPGFVGSAAAIPPPIAFDSIFDFATPSRFASFIFRTSDGPIPGRYSPASIVLRQNVQKQPPFTCR